MGCDIHVAVERKRNNKWVRVSDKFGPINYYYTPGFENEKSFRSDKNVWDISRHYQLFSILAGVRGSIQPIVSPRGIPDDASLKTKKQFNAWKGAAHTPSYYLLSELLSGKELSYTDDYFLDLEDWELFKKKGIEYCNSYQYINDATLVSNQEMDRIQNMKAMLDDKLYLTKVTVESKYLDVNSIFWNQFVPAMEKLDANPQNVRLIFWFDN